MSAPSASAPSMWTPLKYRTFRRLMLASTVSRSGSWMQTLAAGWLVYHLTGSAAAVGTATLLSRGPGLALSSLGGQLADRYDPRRLTVILELVQAAASGVIALVDLLGDVRVGEVYACVLVVGVSAALSRAAAFQATIHTVPDELRKTAIGLSSTVSNVARLVGSALGGTVVVVIGVGACFGFNAVSFLVMALALHSLPPGPAASSGTRSRLRDGLAAVRARSGPRTLLIGMVLFSTLVLPIQELAPAVAKTFGDGADVLGFLLSGLAVGGIVGAALRFWLNQLGVPLQRMLGGSMSACGLGLVGLAVTDNLALGVLAMVAIGVFWDVVWVESQAGVAVGAPAELSGLMLGLFFTITLGGVSLGALAIGGLIDVIGIAWALGACGVAAAAYGQWSFRRPAPTAALAHG